MSEMLPVMLRLEGKTVVVVGGGSVALRKIRDLVQTGAHVIVIALLPTPELESLPITLHQTAYTVGMLAAMLPRPVLVFAATDSREVNQQVLDEARELGILANTVDDSAQSDFHSMTTIRRGTVTAGISTQGASPALSRHLRQQIEQVIGEEYGILAQWMGEVRPLVKEKIESEAERAAFWREVIESSVLARLREGDEAGARAVFEGLAIRYNLT